MNKVSEEYIIDKSLNGYKKLQTENFVFFDVLFDKSISWIATKDIKMDNIQMMRVKIPQQQDPMFSYSAKTFGIIHTMVL